MSQRSSKSHPGYSRDDIEIEAVDSPGATPSGRPAFDHRGTTVWEWHTATGVYSRDASTTRVQSLQALNLALEQTVIVKRLGNAASRLKVAPCGGLNPYDHAPTEKATPFATPPPVAMAPARRPSTRPSTGPMPMPPRRPVTLIGRLRALFAGK